MLTKVKFSSQTTSFHNAGTGGLEPFVCVLFFKPVTQQQIEKKKKERIKKYISIALSFLVYR